MTDQWFTTLTDSVAARPCVILRFESQEWRHLRESRHGVSEFTIARPHNLVERIKTPAVCLIYGENSGRFSREPGEPEAYFGIVSSRSAVTTLETRIKIKRALSIDPPSEQSLGNLVVDQPFTSNLKRKLGSEQSVIVLSPKLSRAILDALVKIESNRGALHAVAASLSAPRRFKGAAALQEDAIQTALKAFDAGNGEGAVRLELVKGRTTGLARVGIIEDSVIEHDARSIHGYNLIGSDLTGRAMFQRGDQQLEVFTANRRSLEQVFGVDLIYLNLTQQNIVMLQYKMLEPSRRKDSTDWLYRPDEQLDEEVRRMSRFSEVVPGDSHEYRLNAGVFYLKFVKRDGALKSGSVIIPLDHYRQMINDPRSKGPRGALRISYESLSGRYLRQTAFINLIQSGYIGASSKRTKHLATLVHAVVDDNRAVVAALQRPLKSSEQPQQTDPRIFL